MRQLTVWTLVMLTLVPSITGAQERYPARERLGPLAQAARKAASNSGMPLAVRSQASQQTQSQPKWTDRHPLLATVLVFAAGGAGIGAGAGALAGGGDANADPPVKPHRLQAAGTGAVVGGTIGALLVFACWGGCS